MVHHHPDYAGPAALARAYSLIADGRDGMFQERLAASLPSCHECRTEANCTDVCPKGISPTRAIKFIQRVALTQRGKAVEEVEAVRESSDAVAPWRPEIDRATFLKYAAVFALGTGVALT